MEVNVGAIEKVLSFRERHWRFSVDPLKSDDKNSG